MLSRCRLVVKTIPGARTVKETSVTGEECDAKGADIGKNVQGITQEFPSLHQTRANEKTTVERKKTITNGDCLGKGYRAKNFH